MATGRVPTTANSPLTAKGDLFTYSTAPARLAVGNDGEQIVADSSATTGLRYSATPAASNPVINSAMQVWQRGTSITMSTSAYTADRWQGYRGVAGGTVSRQVTGDTTNLPFIQYCARVQRDVSNTSTTNLYLAQTLESVNSIPFAGKTITFSFYARKGANYSQANSQIPFALYGAATTDANVLTSMSGTLITSVNATLTTTWQRFSGTATVSASYTQIGIYADFVPVGTAGAADYFEVTGVQIDIGSVALPFRTYAATIQGELAACQRYFYLLGTGTGQLLGNGVYVSATQFSAPIPFPVTMRTAPTLSVTTGTNYYDTYNGASNTFNTLIIFGAGVQSAGVANTSATGTQYRPAYLETNNAASFVAFSAEL